MAAGRSISRRHIMLCLIRGAGIDFDGRIISAPLCTEWGGGAIYAAGDKLVLLVILNHLEALATIDLKDHSVFDLMSFYLWFSHCNITF